MAAVAPVVPLMRHQLGQGHEQGVAPAARLTIGAVVVVAGVVQFVRDRRAADGVGRLVLLAAVVPVATVVILTLGQESLLITRYTAVAAPFLILVIAATVAGARTRRRLALAVTAGLVGVAGVAASHAPGGHYPDMRGAFAAIGDRWQARDVVVASG